MKKIVLWSIGVLAVAIIAFCGSFMSSRVEQANYEIIETHGSIEIRDYVPIIIAEVEVSGERKEAINDGFRLIAGYIFGNNKTDEKIAMTAPVMQQAKGNKWHVRFMMPSKTTLKTLPKPNANSIKLKEVKAKRFAVIRFSGFAGKQSLYEEQKKLEDFIKSRNLHVASSPIYAFFNPPWTLPFLRRNEVMIELQK